MVADMDVFSFLKVMLKADGSSYGEGDRLIQAYGEGHRFETAEPLEGGFAVIIEIPFEKRETAEKAMETARTPAIAG